MDIRRNSRTPCTSLKDASLLGVVGKVYGKVVVKGIREGSEGRICNAQDGITRERGCMSHICNDRYATNI